jgi:hypothetical protein
LFLRWNSYRLKKALALSISPVFSKPIIADFSFSVSVSDQKLVFFTTASDWAANDISFQLSLSQVLRFPVTFKKNQIKVIDGPDLTAQSFDITASWLSKYFKLPTNGAYVMCELVVFSSVTPVIKKVFASILTIGELLPVFSVVYSKVADYGFLLAAGNEGYILYSGLHGAYYTGIILNTNFTEVSAIDMPISHYAIIANASRANVFSLAAANGSYVYFTANAGSDWETREELFLPLRFLNKNFVTFWYGLASTGVMYVFNYAMEVVNVIGGGESYLFDNIVLGLSSALCYAKSGNFLIPVNPVAGSFGEPFDAGMVVKAAAVNNSNVLFAGNDDDGYISFVLSTDLMATSSIVVTELIDIVVDVSLISANVFIIYCLNGWYYTSNAGESFTDLRPDASTIQTSSMTEAVCCALLSGVINVYKAL